MRKIVKKFGLDVIVRHDYSGKQLKVIHSYIKKSVDFVLRFLENYPYADKIRRVLDVGAGDGYAMKLFKKKGFEVEGIDLYPAFKIVKKLDFYELEKLNKKYDLIFCNHTLEHADSAYRLMEQMTKVLNVDGILFIAVPNGLYEWAWSLLDSTTHFSIFTPQFLDTMVKRFGFNTILTTKELRPGKNEIWLIGIKVK